MKQFTLTRHEQTDCSTWGELAADEGPICKVLERGAKNPQHVRIPAGTYQIVRRPIGESQFDSRSRELMGRDYKGALLLCDVPGRSAIEIHPANLIQQLEGCLAPGLKIARDGHGDFCVEGGASKPAYVEAYRAISAAIDQGGASIAIRDGFASVDTPANSAAPLTA